MAPTTRTAGKRKTAAAATPKPRTKTATAIPKSSAKKSAAKKPIAKKKSTTATKKKPTPSKKLPSASQAKKKKTAVQTSVAAPPVVGQRQSGVVDPEFKQDGTATIAVDDNNLAYDAHLCLVDPAANNDKYYVLQIVHYNDQYTCFNRWGRTGLKGQTQSQGPYDDLDDAATAFEKKFKEKTGNQYSTYTDGSFQRVPGKYDCLSKPVAAGVAAARAAGVDWQYEVTDNVAGKTNGWYSYDLSNADEVEALYQAWVLNPAWAWLSSRIISSDTSGFDYHVDLQSMKQRNQSTNKTRNIRRLNPNGFDFEE